MNVDTNSAISVDCAVFGFDGQSLKVLLIRRRYVSEGVNPDDLKLPGAMIMENETLPDAASRVLKESTGLSGINLKQTEIYSNPARTSAQELEWICEFQDQSRDNGWLLCACKADPRNRCVHFAQGCPMG